MMATKQILSKLYRQVYTSVRCGRCLQSSQNGPLLGSAYRTLGNRLTQHRRITSSSRSSTDTAEKLFPPLEGCHHVDVSADGKLVTLGQVKGRELRFNATWLRHNCHCAECKQAHSGQRLTEPSALQPLYTVKQVSVKDGCLRIAWQEEGHEGVVPVSHLLQHDYSDHAREAIGQDRLPKVIKNGVIPDISFEEIKQSEEGQLKWLQQLSDYGVSIVRGVPTEHNMVKTLSDHIWPAQRTIYGEVFDVVSSAKPINVAYSSIYLGLHMDLVYYESPPGIQFLHCHKFDKCVQGGESIFIDSWDAAEELREQFPHMFHTLITVPATFQKIHFDREHPVYMRSQKPHIVVNSAGSIIGINWAPAFEGPLCVAEDLIEDYYTAYQKYAQLLEDSKTRLEVRLVPGDAVCFNNRRLLHGRKEFILNGGVRHLQGTYVNIDEFKSQVDYLSRKVGNGQPAKRAFNNCLLF